MEIGYPLFFLDIASFIYPGCHYYHASVRSASIQAIHLVYLIIPFYAASFGYNAIVSHRYSYFIAHPYLAGGYYLGTSLVIHLSPYGFYIHIHYGLLSKHLTPFRHGRQYRNAVFQTSRR